MTELKPRTTRISLASMGPEWTDCYVEMRALRFSDVNLFSSSDASNVVSLLETLFVAGKGIDIAGNPVDLTAEDLSQIDVQTLTEVTQSLSGVAPNA